MASSSIWLAQSGSTTRAIEDLGVACLALHHSCTGAAVFNFGLGGARTGCGGAAFGWLGYAKSGDYSTVTDTFVT